MPNKQWKELFIDSYTEWQEDKVPRLGAALAYYTVFSLAPLLLLILSGLSLFYEKSTVRSRLLNEISVFIGSETAEAVGEIAQSASRSGQALPSLIGIFTLLVGASAVFAQLQTALDEVWDVAREKPESFIGGLLKRWASLLMVASIGFLLLVSLVVSAVLASLGDHISLFGPFSNLFMQTTNIILPFIFTTLLFALIFKILPNVEVPWRSVWIGALVTSLLFTIGKILFGLYLGYSTFESTYGAAGSVIIILLWSYYSSQILLFGAELSQVHARKLHMTLSPKPGYRWM